ncbi:MAG: hypothetical protein SCARUB_01658 [Candidatus Scalindua rubra]|uniref:Uncharacterized protein n=1 Tax=Candidatus Scalindua rubra TaxID=1872076 RepID=A0A1E3XC51_9BACT|nr:MAG: hypothetical protein SCARUB_01658 [Candidatus Scalindua rubra]
MNTLAIIAKICGSSVAIAWFIRDVRRQNSKELKNQSKLLEGQSKILSEQTHILAKIEEGQRKGFETLEKGQVKLAEILQLISSNLKKT